MEYTLLSQICTVWIIIAFLWGKFTVGLNIGKRIGDIKFARWKFEPGFVFLQLFIGIFVMWGTGFFHQWEWPQIVWVITTVFGMGMIIPIIYLIKSGLFDDQKIEYGFFNFFGDAFTLVLYYFGHVYGPIGVNPWPA